MNKGIITILVFFGFTSANFAQNDGVLSFDVPAKNSLKFNKFLIHPSFSFVREDEAFISVLNKKQFAGLDNAPEAYFVSYSGKFRDQNALGLGLFQRKFGVLTSFGAVANFARNVELRDENNLTFGFNLAYLNSGLNSSAIIVNDLSDPSIANTPKNSLFTVNPGINYGSRFIDLGLSVNNLFYYNLSDSNLVSDDPKKSVSGHFMYTGYLNNSGILENSKFSTLLKADLGKEKTVLSGAILFNAPKAFWAQAGYHTLNGASVGVGFILAKKFSIGYTLEKGLSNFSGLGMSHEITLAYKIKGYGDFEDYKPIVRATNKTNPVKNTPQRPANEIAKERQAELLKRQAEQRAKIEAERQRKQQEMADAKAALDAKNKAVAEAKLKQQQDKQNSLSEASRLKLEQDKARLEAERLRKEQELADAKAKADAEKLRKEQELADAKAKATEAERLRKEKELADAKAKATEAERLRKEKELADAKAKADAEKLRKEQELADAKAKATEAERLRKEKELADAKAKAEAERLRKEQELADAKAKADAEKLRKEQEAADAKAKATEAERLRKEKELADAKAKAEAERLRKEQELADAKAKADAEKLRKEQELADAKAKADAEKLRKEQEAADAKAKAEEVERLRKEKAESERLKVEEEKAKAEAERLRKEKELADAKAKADAEKLRKEQEAAERLKAEAQKLEASKIEEDKQIDYLSQVIEDSKKNQSESLNKLQLAVNEKKAELLEMRKANDLSEQGIVTEVKEYKNTSAANRALEALKIEIAENSKNQDNLIKNYEKLASDRLKKVTNKNDALNQSYAKTIEKLKAEKSNTDKQNSELIAQLEQIKTETEIEKKRRIKRAQFDSNDAKYQKDRAALGQIKASTVAGSKQHTESEFDFGDSQANMQILKNIDKTEEGFYLVYAAHKDESKRNDFVKKAIESGQGDIDFFYSVSTGTYYIYSQHFTDIQEATRALESTRGSKVYNGKMVIVKVEK